MCDVNKTNRFSYVAICYQHRRCTCQVINVATHVAKTATVLFTFFSSPYFTNAPILCLTHIELQKIQDDTRYKKFSHSFKRLNFKKKYDTFIHESAALR